MYTSFTVVPTPLMLLMDSNLNQFCNNQPHNDDVYKDGLLPRPVVRVSRRYRSDT